MRLQNVAFNFLVKNGKGELVKSVLCRPIPPKFQISSEKLKYAPFDIVEITKTHYKLDKTSEACSFFGVDSLENLSIRIKNHKKLNEIMEKRGTYSGISTTIEDFEKNFFDIEKYDKKRGLTFSPCNIYVQPNFFIGHAMRGAKVTLLDGFNFQGQPWVHSIGLIQDYSGRLFILDSLGNQTKELQKLHEKIGKIISERAEKSGVNPIHRVICNLKPQQYENELTCNNWTYANLEAIKKAMKKEAIRTAEELDAILPKDINKNLEEQMQIVKNSL